MVGPKFFDGVIGDLGKVVKRHTKACYGSKHWCRAVLAVTSSVHRVIRDVGPVTGPESSACESRRPLLLFSLVSQLTALGSPQTGLAPSCPHWRPPTQAHPRPFATTPPSETLTLPTGCESPQNPKHISFHSFNRDELITYYFPGPMLGTIGGINMTKTVFSPGGTVAKGQKDRQRKT